MSGVLARLGAAAAKAEAGIASGAAKAEAGAARAASGARRPGSKMDDIVDAEIISERKIKPLREEAEKKLGGKSVFGSIKDFAKKAMNERLTPSTQTDSTPDDGTMSSKPKSFKDELKDTIKGHLKQAPSGKDLRDAFIQKKNDAIESAKSKTLEAVKDPLKAAKGFGRTAMEHLSAGIFKKDDSGDEDKPLSDDKGGEKLDVIANKLDDIKGLLKNTNQGNRLIENRLSRLPAALRLPRNNLPQLGYKPKGSTGLKVNQRAGFNVIEQKPMLALPNPNKPMQLANNAAASAKKSEGGSDLVGTVMDQVGDFMGDKLAKRGLPTPKSGGGMMGRAAQGAGRLALQGARLLAPAAAVAGAGYAGYQAGGWLNDKMNNAEAGSGWETAKNVRDNTFDTIFSGVDNITGGGISGNAEQAKKNWDASAGGKTFNKVKDAAMGLWGRGKESAKNITTAVPALTAELEKQGVATNMKEKAMVLGQLAHETGGFSKMEEGKYSADRVWDLRGKQLEKQGVTKDQLQAAEKSGGKDAMYEYMYADKYREGGNKLGNTEDGDAAKYKGRGMIQLTGKSNYEKAGKELGLDLLSDPEMVTRDPEVNAKVTTWFLKNNKKSMEGIKTGDVDKLSQGINGGAYGKSVGAEDRRLQTAKAEQALAGITPDKESAQVGAVASKEPTLQAQADAMPDSAKQAILKPMVEKVNRGEQLTNEEQKIYDALKPASQTAVASKPNFEKVVKPAEVQVAQNTADSAKKAGMSVKASDVEKLNSSVANSDTITDKTDQVKVAENKPNVVVVPGQQGGGHSNPVNVREAGGAAKLSVPMVSRNMDNSIQRITAGQMGYSSA